MLISLYKSSLQNFQFSSSTLQVPKCGDENCRYAKEKFLFPLCFYSSFIEKKCLQRRQLTNIRIKLDTYLFCKDDKQLFIQINSFPDKQFRKT